MQARRRRLAAAVAITVAGLVAAAPAASAKPLSVPWPPIPKKGALFVHFGEEHINDADGATLLPRVVSESIRYRPDLVTMSGDKADDGEEERRQTVNQEQDAPARSL